MPLTDTTIKNAKPDAKPQKLFDGGGLFLFVKSTGQKYWRLKYRIAGKEKLLALGVYPDVSLVAARKKRDEARELLAAGIDPGEARKDDRRTARLNAESSFEAVAREWFEAQRGGRTASYADKVIASLEGDVFPTLGGRPIAAIEAHRLVEALRAVEARGVRETAKRILQRSRGVFQFGIMTGRCTRRRAARFPVPPFGGAASNWQPGKTGTKKPTREGRLLRLGRLTPRYRYSSISTVPPIASIRVRISSGTSGTRSPLSLYQ
ncbi:hypothetical protein HDG37_001548 [Paraburkholderia sp. MM5384-R2]|nr:hypothetical protein [Paraburkholderia sp. MM5384-R2]